MLTGDLEQGKLDKVHEVCSMGSQPDNNQIIDVGSRLELLVDEFLIERMDGVKLVLNRPVPREIAIDHDRPWEGNECFYHTVFRDGNVLRMYYLGAHSGADPNHHVICYAESGDGIRWTKPELGLVEFNGSKKNNIILDWLGTHHTLAVFRDLNPGYKPEERYKAVANCVSNWDGGATIPGGLFPLKSPDGIRWSMMSKTPVITKGAFDSQNLAFWDTLRGCYVDYHRGWKGRVEGQSDPGIRDILTCTSDDFLNWTEPEWLEYPGAPSEHLYTNQVTPYFRAPHIYMGFPMRFVPSHTRVVPSAGGSSDALFMTSRDGKSFKRWSEALIRPGFQRERWTVHDNMVAWGIAETRSDLPGTPNELSIYSVEGYDGFEGCKIRRYTQRMDGFVSAQAPLSGGELLTKPLTFEGTQLVINYSTSAAGSIRTELLDRDGGPIEGLGLADSVELFGDEVEEVVTWKGGSDLSRLAGTPIRVRFVMSDADLFSFRFRSIGGKR